MSVRVSLPVNVKEGVVSVRHGFGTEDVAVRCETASGEPVGFLFAVPISLDEVEVAVTPQVAAVIVEPATE